MAARIAVVYLARAPQGLSQFEPFARSYRAYPADQPHDLIVLGKGMTKRGERVATSLLFSGLPHQLIEVSDEGYDIHAYLKVANLIDHDYICFFNTYCEIRSASWLKKLYDHATADGVGLVGTTASYESLFNSWKLISKAAWVAGKGVRFDPLLAKQFGSRYLPRRWLTYSKYLPRYFLRLAGDLIYRRPRGDAAIDEEFERYWFALTRDGGPAAPFRDFPPFPNPHIRSNGFMISRKLLLSFRYQVELTKEACCHFESGQSGLSRRFALVVRRTCSLGIITRARLLDPTRGNEQSGFA